MSKFRLTLDEVYEEFGPEAARFVVEKQMLDHSTVSRADLEAAIIKDAEHRLDDGPGWFSEKFGEELKTMMGKSLGQPVTPLTKQQLVDAVKALLEKQTEFSQLTQPPSVIVAPDGSDPHKLNVTVQVQPVSSLDFLTVTGPDWLVEGLADGDLDDE